MELKQDIRDPESEEQKGLQPEKLAVLFHRTHDNKEQSAPPEAQPVGAEGQEELPAPECPPEERSRDALPEEVE